MSPSKLSVHFSKQSVHFLFRLPNVIYTFSESMMETKVKVGKNAVVVKPRQLYF